MQCVTLTCIETYYYIGNPAVLKWSMNGFCHSTNIFCKKEYLLETGWIASCNKTTVALEVVNTTCINNLIQLEVCSNKI